MHDLEHIPRSPSQEVTVLGRPDSLAPARVPLGEMPGPGLKRDYAGVLEYWQMVRRHKGTVVVTTFLGGLIAFLSSLPAARIYQARTTLEIQGLNQDFLNMRNVSPTVQATSNDYPDYDIQTQVKILQSKTLSKRAQTKLEAQTRNVTLQPPDRLSVWRKAMNLAAPSQDALWRQALGSAAGSLKIRSSGTNRIVEVLCDSTNPRVAADFANTLAKEYIEQNLEARWQSTEYTGQWLTNQLQDLKVKLEKSEEQLQAYARATGLMFTDEKNNVDEAKLSDLQKTLSEAQADRMTKQSKYEMAAASPPGAVPDVLDDSSLHDSQNTLNDLKARLAQLRVSFTPNHQEVRRVEAQITSLEAAQQKELSNILTRIRNEYNAAQRRENLLLASYVAQSRLVSQQGEKTAHYSLLKREVDASRLLYESMLQKLKEASIASALRASNIRIVDIAEPPTIPYKPDVRQNITMGLLAGIFLGVVFVVFRERADRTLQDPGDPAYYLNLPELGVVPLGNEQLSLQSSKRLAAQLSIRGGNGKPMAAQLTLRSGTNKHSDLAAVENPVELMTWNHKSSLLAESFRTTLTSILFSGQNGCRPRILMFTSASPKEGKTTVVSNLGISLAEIRQPVLLIDADMRRPRLHQVFNIENGLGLSDLLLEKTPLDLRKLEAVVRETPIPGLYLLTSGQSRHSASSLVHSQRLAELVTLGREKFDTVIVDTPPMVNISDARVVARHADAVILVLRSAMTTRDAALLAKRTFAEDGIQILGTILNWWNPSTPGYGYYKYYYAGYYHYYGGGNGNAAATANGSTEMSASKSANGSEP
jgi:succinoglycan biosynthesis transport protein ExoP